MDPDEVIRNRAFRAPTPRRTPAEDLFTDADFEPQFREQTRRGNQQRLGQRLQDLQNERLIIGAINTAGEAAEGGGIPFQSAGVVVGTALGGPVGGAIGGVAGQLVEGLFDGATPWLERIFNQGQDPIDAASSIVPGLGESSPAVQRTTVTPLDEILDEDTITGRGEPTFPPTMAPEESSSTDVDPLSLIPSAIQEEPPDQVLTGRGEPTQPPFIRESATSSVPGLLLNQEQYSRLTAGLPIKEEEELLPQVLTCLLYTSDAADE